ncbi:thioredoxin domain-containing protein [Arthrobacter roseus]|uniref:thioredoxin domain-containing protein n=1 Tax=Arthrobacter roseus TaxID=136274 RepID=UPI0019664A6A|nr:thioredoxin domain-containing protein [Arthrobacter roseus]MBM7847980.1 uncharacterized protein YyaL (SSP411 family) [Arthrobacter roseus]
MGGRLSSEASAYLRQHAHNPVDWWPFGDAAFEQARLREVPVFVSVGYAACHWCHVMAHESFEDDELAGYLNENFVSIKVDREERPDVDAVYMAATQAMTGQGGWPMSVFTLPDGRAFYAGTYFPPEPRHGSASFRQVLEAINDAWSNRREQVEASAEGLAGSLGEAQQRNRALLLTPPGTDPSSRHWADAAVEKLLKQEDRYHGGFGNAPKFPPSTVLPFLQKFAAERQPEPAELTEAASGLVDRTLESMAVSGLYDQVEGGFSRYTVDAAWAIPHFEKMLYDNVQLIRSYAWWSASADSPEHQQLAVDVVRRSADWMIRRLRVADGAFASSLDADTLIDGHAVEGGTYTWTVEQLSEILGADDGRAAAELFDLSTGLMETGASTLHPGRLWNVDERALWDRLRPALQRARDRRPQPARDDKVVAGWNGLAVAALADAGVLLKDQELLSAAKRTAEYLIDVHCHDGRLTRVSHDGKAQGIEGMLEDYAGVAEGYFALYAATGEEHWYREGEQLVHAAGQKFMIDGVLRDSAVVSPQLARAQATESAADPLDGPSPSGTALYAGVLATYAAYSGSEPDRQRAEDIVQHAMVLGDQAPRAVGWAMGVAHTLFYGPGELAVVGHDRDQVVAVACSARRVAGPGLTTALDDGSEVGVPLVAGRSGLPGLQAYLCRNMVCGMPVSTEEELVRLLR